MQTFTHTTGNTSQRWIFTRLCIAGGAEKATLTFEDGRKPLTYRENRAIEPLTGEHAFPITNKDGETVATLTLQYKGEVPERFVKMMNFLLEQKHIDLKTPLLYPIAARHAHIEPNLDQQIDFLKELSPLFMQAVKEHSPHTATHSAKVGGLFAAFMKNVRQDPADFKDTPLADINDKHLKLYRLLGNLHDLGKFYTPSELLEKGGRLDTEELAVMRHHPHNTTRVLTLLNPMLNSYDVLALMAGEHHIHNRRPTYANGTTSYPYHTARNTPNEDRTNPSFEAKILKLCDEYKGMISRRPYQGEKHDPHTRNIRSPAEALKELVKEANDWIVNPVALHYFLEHKIYRALKGDEAQLAEADATAQQILECRLHNSTHTDTDINLTFMDNVEKATPRLTEEEHYAISTMREREALAHQRR